MLIGGIWGLAVKPGCFLRSCMSAVRSCGPRCSGWRVRPRTTTTRWVRRSPSSGRSRDHGGQNTRAPSCWAAVVPETRQKGFRFCGGWASEGRAPCWLRTDFQDARGPSEQSSAGPKAWRGVGTCGEGWAQGRCSKED